jgi:malonyl-CoA decarboxylase
MINQTLLNLRAVWQNLNILKSDRLKVQADLSVSDVETMRAHMRVCLDGKGGDVSARAHAAKLGEAYLGLSDIGRLRFLRILAEDFGVDAQQVNYFASAILSEDSAQSLADLHQKMRKALRPSALELLTKFNSIPSGVKFLVDMRADLLRLADRTDPKINGLNKSNELNELNELDQNLKGLLRSWFDVGFLDLIRMSWSTPAELLEKLIDYEAVHAIRSWSDLKNRLQADRRCFAFFHPRMPDEPIIFVQVALVNSLSSNIQELLDESAPAINPYKANTAIFYSISNAQMGLTGVGFGDFLIKRVVADLKTELPNITMFSTLSPVPGLLKWLNQQDESELLSVKERQDLSGVEGFSSLAGVLAIPGWYMNTVLAEALRIPLMRLTAHYLVNLRRRHRALDPVANFHLNNGARLERINWLADISIKGMQESAGIMVNYLYKLDEIEANHEAYRETAATIKSSMVASILKS